MSAGFGALRNDCPMQFQRCYIGYPPSDAVRADLARIETLWSHARSLSGAADGPLFGTYSLADVFYTPVAARIVGYGLPVSEASLAYCRMLLTDPDVLEWRRAASEVSYDPEPYPHPRSLDAAPWPF